MAELNFNAAQVPVDEFETIPVGTYEAMMVNSDIQETKNKRGSYLRCEFEILTGKYKGRKIIDNVNLKNENSQAVEIARKQLASICRAVGVMSLRDSVQLHNLPLMIKVGTHTDKDGNIYNDIKRYSPKSSGVSNPPSSRRAPAPAPQAQAPQVDDQSVPW